MSNIRQDIAIINERLKKIYILYRKLKGSQGGSGGIENVKVNGSELPIVDNGVNITVPTKTSNLINDSGYTTNTELNKKLDKPVTNNTNQFVILGDGSTAPKNDFGKVDTVNNIAPDSNKNVDIGIDDVLRKGNESDQDINIVGESSDTIITKENIILNNGLHSAIINGNKGFVNYDEGADETVSISLEDGLIVDKKVTKNPGDDTGDFIYKTIELFTNNGEVIKKSEIVNENYDEGEGYANKWSALYDTYYGNSKIYFTDENTAIDNYYTKTILDTYNGFYSESKTLTSIKSAWLNVDSLSFNEQHNDGYYISSSSLSSEAIVFEGMYNQGTNINSLAMFGNTQNYNAFGTKPCAYFVEEDKTDLKNKQRVTMYNVDGAYSYSSIYGSSIENPMTYFHIELPKVPTENTENYIVDFRLKSGTVALTSDIQDIYAKPTHWTNASQRFSGLVDKSADATYNRVMVLDADGKAGVKNLNSDTLIDILTNATPEKITQIKTLLGV